MNFPQNRPDSLTHWNFGTRRPEKKTTERCEFFLDFFLTWTKPLTNKISKCFRRLASFTFLLAVFVKKWLLSAVKVSRKVNHQSNDPYMPALWWETVSTSLAGAWCFFFFFGGERKTGRLVRIVFGWATGGSFQNKTMEFPHPTRCPQRSRWTSAIILKGTLISVEILVKCSNLPDVFLLGQGGWLYK